MLVKNNANLRSVNLAILHRNICSEHSLWVLGGKRLLELHAAIDIPRTRKKKKKKTHFPPAVFCNTEQGFFFLAAADARLNVWASPASSP